MKQVTVRYSSPWGRLGGVSRRGHLSLLCGIPLDRKKHSNRLLLGTPSLGGDWEGFPDEGICPHLEAQGSREVGVRKMKRRN